MVWTNGEPLSAACSVSVFRASETETPSLTSEAACLRLAGVIRFTAPIWSCLPQRPQLDSSVIQLSTIAAVTEWPDCASAAPARVIAITSVLDLFMMAFRGMPSYHYSVRSARIGSTLDARRAGV